MALLNVPLPNPITDEDLIRINERNAGWKIERASDVELEARLVGVGIISCITAELLAQVANWRTHVGGGLARASSAAYNLRDASGNQSTRSPNGSWISQARIDSAPRGTLSQPGFPSLCPDFVI